MSKIINLRQARKTVARDSTRKQGDENAAKFGRTKAQRQAEEQAVAKVRAHLDGHLVDKGDGRAHD